MWNIDNFLFLMYNGNVRVYYAHFTKERGVVIVMRDFLENIKDWFLGLFRKKEHSILVRLMGPIMVIILAQVLVFILVMLASGALEYVYDSSYQILNEKTTLHANHITTELVEKRKIVTNSTPTINSVVSSKLLALGREAYEIRTDKELGNEILEGISSELTNVVMDNPIEGAFVILNDGEETGEYTTLYLKGRDLNGGSNLQIVKGTEEIAELIGAKKQSTYSFSDHFTFNDKDAEEAKYFFEPLEAAMRGDGKDCGYWSMPFLIENYIIESMTYTEPLVAADGTVYGVVGIEFIERYYIRSLLQIDSEHSIDNVVYLLAQNNDNIAIKDYKVASGSHERFQNHYANTGILNLGGNEVHNDIYRIMQTEDEDEEIYGSVKELQLYPNNSSFATDRWFIIGVVDEHTLFGFSDSLMTTAAYAVVVSVLFGLLGVLIVARLVTQPMTKIVREVNNLDTTRNVWFEKTNIREIDMLTSSIKNLSERIVSSTTKLSQILNVLDISIGAFEYDDASDLAYCTEGFYSLMGWNTLTYIDGYVGKEFLSRKIEEMIPYETSGNESWYRIEDDYGNIRFVKFTVTELGTRTLGIAEDVTKDVQEKRKLEFERDYDLLTGIYNRRAFKREVSGLFLSETVDLRVACVMMMDLDNLKYINDTYGHDYGDEYIRKSAEILSSAEKWGGIVARMSGDEFYVFLSGYDTKEEIRNIIMRIKKVFNSTEIEMPDGSKIKLRASAGIAWYPDDSKDFEELLRYADFAMYTVKHSVKGDICEFDGEKYHKDAILLSGKEELNKIIESELVRYALQPIVDARSGEIFAYEALMRPQGETLKTPLDVIRVARQQAKMYQIEKLTWHKSMQAYINQIESGNISPGAKLFLNSFSSQILTDEDFNDYEQRYKEYLPNIVMEVLESDELDEGFARKKSEYVRGWGGIIALDDFGTGYNGDYSLILLNPDLVKIDMNMVRSVDTDENKQELILNLISYAKRQNIKILAEGVQTRGEMEKLVEFGVDYMQGNYFALPMFVPSQVSESVKQELIEANRILGR